MQPNIFATVLLLALSTQWKLSEAVEICRMHILPATVNSTWQSSSYSFPFGGSRKLVCFSEMAPEFVGGFRYFHSLEGRQSAEQGFHWFIVRLKQPTDISSVALTNRDVGQVVKDLDARASDIEVWTSPHAMDFGPERCFTRCSIWQEFQRKENRWSLCGATPTVESVRAAETLTVPCENANRVQTILLRKYVANQTVHVRECMSFVDLWLNLKPGSVDLSRSRNPVLRGTNIPAICIVLDADCPAAIATASVSRTWQSSSFGGICLANYLDGFGSTHLYFHSMNSRNTSVAVNGYHWLAVRLRHPSYVKSVIVMNREFPIQHSFLSERAAHIEIWTTPDLLDFGDEACTSVRIATVFEETKSSSWQLCGSTPSAAEMNSGQLLTVRCAKPHMVRTLLMRKYVANIVSELNQCMAFSNLWIDASYATVEMQPANEVSLKSSVTVRCTAVCPTVTAKSTLCLPDGTCLLNSREMRIASVIASHAGNYSCWIDGNLVDSKALSVVYPPRDLSIELQSATYRVGSLVAVLSFTFGTSAANPECTHLCNARATGGIVTLQTRQTAGNSHAVKATQWSLTIHYVNAQPNHSPVVITCRAEQGTGETRQVSTVWTGEEILSGKSMSQKVGAQGTSASIGWCIGLIVASLLLTVGCIAFCRKYAKTGRDTTHNIGGYSFNDQHLIIFNESFAERPNDE